MMKHIVTLLLLLFPTGIALSHTDSIRGNQFELTGKIVNQINLTPACGCFAFGTVIEFEIMTFSDSTYKSDTIGVIFTCPEFYQKGFFEVGKTYTIKLADENQADFSWSIPNENLLDKYPLKKKLWVLDAKKAN